MAVAERVQIRGAPAIGVLGALSVAVELTALVDQEVDVPLADLGQSIVHKFDYLLTARPTAVNIRNARNEFVELVRVQLNSLKTTSTSLCEECVCLHGR